MAAGETVPANPCPQGAALLTPSLLVPHLWRGGWCAQLCGGMAAAPAGRGTLQDSGVPRMVGRGLHVQTHTLVMEGVWPERLVQKDRPVDSCTMSTRAYSSSPSHHRLQPFHTNVMVSARSALNEDLKPLKDIRRPSLPDPFCFGSWSCGQAARVTPEAPRLRALVSITGALTRSPLLFFAYQ